MPSLPFLPLRALATGLGLVSCLCAQRVVAEVPLGGIAEPAQQISGEDDPGVAVEVVENDDLNRYLRRAQAFLDRQDYAQAIELLQELIEGRSIEVVADPKGASAVPGDGAGPSTSLPGGAARPAPDGPAKPTPGGTAKPTPGGTAKPTPGGTAKPTPGSAAPQEPSGRVRRTADARSAVFAANGRLYRPVRRLCHELLARLPAGGIEIYRTNYEVAAEELLRKAENEGSISGLEQVANRYFVTLAAGRAMALLADRLMHEGRYRAAVQVLRDLTEVYPADNRKRIGVNPLWCGFKIALCLRFAGEDEAAHAEATRLAAAHPDESLRLLGELQAVAELPAGKLFARDFVATAPATAAVSWLDATTTELVPLWQYRFRNPDPFREPKTKANNNEFLGRAFGEGGPVPANMPHPGRYGASGWVTFASESAEAPRALFLEHYRLRAVDALSGLLVGEGAGPDDPPPPREGHPRVRIAAADQALLRPVDDGQRRYVVIGHSRATASNTDALKSSTLVAYRRELDREEWSTAQWGDGPGGLRDVTFLAAPTVFGERLLLPALRFGFYSLECLDRRTGKPLWNTPLSSGGSPFFKAPGSPVVVHGGIAFVLTNAGTLAAVDSFSGDLRWLRRYERVDSRRRSTKSRGRPASVEFSQMFGFAELAGFYPSDLLVRSGLVLLAPVDGDVLLCLDGASGEPLWWIDGGSRHFTQSCGTPRGLVGATDQRAFLLSDTHLVAIDLRGGLLEWSVELPKWNGPRGSFRGRGAIVDDFVVLPGQGELLVVHGDGKQPLRRIPLRAFDSSRDPLAGIMSLCSHGPWLAVGYAGGIEMFSSAVALERLARTTTAPLRQAGYLVQAGQTAAAIAALRAAIPRTEDQAEARAQSDQLLALVREQALADARAGALEKGLSALDAILELMVGRELRLNWHLARIEICKDVGELRVHEREQERLYHFMEGKG